MDSVVKQKVDESVQHLGVGAVVLELNLRGFTPKTEDSKVLAEALKINNTLINLNLCACMWGENGWVEISKALEKHKTLELLSLEWNNFENMPIESLPNNLKVLSLKYNDTSDDGVGKLTDVLKLNNSLVSLVLSATNIKYQGAKYIADFLRTNKNLKKLELGHNFISDDGAIELAEVLRVNSSLINLNLSTNYIGEKAITKIAEVLKTNETLEVLDLGWNNIGEEGARELADVLKTNKTLISLNLIGNSIKYEGAIEISLALKSNDALTHLNIAHTDIGKTKGGYEKIFRALGENCSLTFLELDVYTDFIKLHIERNKSFLGNKRFKTTKALF